MRIIGRRGGGAPAHYPQITGSIGTLARDNNDLREQNEGPASVEPTKPATGQRRTKPGGGR